MSDYTESAQLLPQHMGSAESLAVLRAMANWRVPISHAELRALTALGRYELSHALQGLSERKRVVCEGKGPHALWRLAYMTQAT